MKNNNSFYFNKTVVYNGITYPVYEFPSKRRKEHQTIQIAAQAPDFHGERHAIEDALISKIDKQRENERKEKEA